MTNAHPTADSLASCLEDSFDLDDVQREIILVGAIISDVVPNIGGIKGALRSAWSSLGALSISHYKRNIFTISTSSEVASQILEGLTLEKMNATNAKIIGEEIGAVLEVEDPVMAKAITRGFLRVKVLIDSRKPFSTSFWLPRSAHQSFRVEYCYEGLGDFCYVCGLLGHCENACKGSSESIRTLSENSWMKRCLPPIYPPLPLEQLNRASRRRPPSARITRIPFT
ncbi:unnamed protein product [Prunus armeniaca]|uniref:Zinc knuckle CX2CX4HX4C domain-containing protein n=1 Tax=Prunus armeniaca TaxID=36596 RepID=A0A6J5XI81_PRUAR|nr:unnamed protein product [Prunus armeniaca]